MRRCPQKGCNTPIIKDETSKGCNRVTCAVCLKDMCYCCRKDVSLEGYRHFDMESKGDGLLGKCPLWEDTIERHKKDIEAARKKMGGIAPKQTSAERNDEVKRRKQLEVALLNMDAPLDEVAGLQLDAEDIILRIPETEQEQWQHHLALLHRRELQATQKQRQVLQKEFDLALDHVHVARQHEVRLQILGIDQIKPEKNYGRLKPAGPAIHFNFDHVKSLPTDALSSKSISKDEIRKVGTVLTPDKGVSSNTLEDDEAMIRSKAQQVNQKLPRYRRRRGPLTRTASQSIPC